jgi:DNA polymerase-3 subunit delta'
MTWTVVGQDAAVAVLTGAVANERVAHAYLFAGPKHVGKTLTALQFAQLLNCTPLSADDAAPCGRCRSCERIASGAHPDVEMVGIGGLCDEEAHKHDAGDSMGIRICQVRRIQHIITRAPYDARRRVIIIEPADAIGRDAVAALLKTLEEPPPYVVFILITDKEELLLDTIRSRARRVAFGGMPMQLIERTLRTRWDVEPSRAAELARLSGGRLGWAVAALHDERMMQQRADALERAEELTSAPVAERFAYAASLGSGYSKNRRRTSSSSSSPTRKNCCSTPSARAHAASPSAACQCRSSSARCARAGTSSRRARPNWRACPAAASAGPSPPSTTNA